MTTPPVDRKSVEALAEMLRQNAGVARLSSGADWYAKTADTLLALLDRAEAAEAKADENKTLWDAACEMAAEDHKEHLKIEDELRARAEKAEASAHASIITSIAWQERAEKAEKERDDAKAEKDEAYRQRNHLVAALARLFPSGICRTDIPGWSDDWHGCCFIDLPSGQISYHFHDSHAHLFSDLPAYKATWDGHDKETVHARLAAITSEREWRPIETAPRDGASVLLAFGSAVWIGSPGTIKTSHWMPLPSPPAMASRP